TECHDEGAPRWHAPRVRRAVLGRRRSPGGPGRGTAARHPSDPGPNTPELEAFRATERSAHEELGKGPARAPATRPVLYVVDNVPEEPADGASTPLSTWCPAVSW